MLKNFNWYKFLANTEVPVKEWSTVRWIYNVVDYLLWVIGITVASNTIYWVYIYAPTFQIMQGLVALILITAAAVTLQMYNDKKLVPEGL